MEFITAIWALSFWWLFIIGTVIVIDILLCEVEEFGWATAVSLISFVLISMFGAKTNPFALVLYNIDVIIGYGLLYFVLGVGWSCCRWYLMLVKDRAKLVRAINKWEALDPNERRERPSLDNTILDSQNPHLYKNRIMGWIGYWPISIIGYFFGSFIKDCVNVIYERCSSVYRRINDHVFQGF